MVYDVVAGAVKVFRKPFARYGHSYRIRYPLTQRSRRGFDSGGDSKLRVTGAEAVKASEFFHVLNRDVVSVYVKSSVEKHGSVTCGKHEAVAVGPVRILGVMP